VLVEGPTLKRKADLRVTQTTVKDGKPTVQSKIRKFTFSKTLTIDDEGGFTEKLFVGKAAVSSPVEKWRYEETGATSLVLTAPGGEKRTLSFSFDGKRLTLRSGSNQVEVFEKK
jgi:hypothetical protein